VQVEIKNGIFELTLSNLDGIVTGVLYNGGVDNLWIHSGLSSRVWAAQERLGAACR
jgi:hypothetical protein